MKSPSIAGIEWATLEGLRPRSAGCNARLGVHGSVVRMPVVRLSLDTGEAGFGFSRTNRDQAANMLGKTLDSIFSIDTGIDSSAAAYEYPILDLFGRLTGQPVYAMAATFNKKPRPATLKVPCYDTSLYLDDVDVATHKAAVDLITEEVRAGMMLGHTSFKLKVGRGARHLPLEDGTVRDIAVIRAVRDTVGTHAALMIDANNGYNLNLAKRVLMETADCNLLWLEEPFHEDAVLYQDLKVWQAKHNLSVMIADGEGEASAHLLDWARQGLIDVVQYDIIGHGFINWLRTGKQLDAWNVRSAPHSYGNCYGNYVAGHLAAGIDHFTAVEWDEAKVPGLDTSAYQILDGYVMIPESAGFGLELDAVIFQESIRNTGGAIWL